MIPLTELPRAYLAKYPLEKLAEVVGKDLRIVERWRVNSVPTLADLQKLMEFDPTVASPVEDDPIGDGQPAPVVVPAAEPEPTPYEWPTGGNKIALLMPSNRGYHPGILKAFAAIYDTSKMQLIDPGLDMPILRARNILAARFLASGCDWALNWDDDTVPPHGDVASHRALSENPFFPESFIKLHPIGRLLQAKKTIVGAVYFSRRRGGRAQFSGAFTNRVADETEHRGPRNVVTEQAWVGMGFTLIHRRVFEDIQKTQPELEIKDATLTGQIGYKWRFYNPLSVTGADSEHSEDVAFCHRAAKAGHRTYVDHAVSCVHVGPHGYSYANTAKAGVPIL